MNIYHYDLADSHVGETSGVVRAENFREALNDILRGYPGADVHTVRIVFREAQEQPKKTTTFLAVYKTASRCGTLFETKLIECDGWAEAGKIAQLKTSPGEELFAWLLTNLQAG